MQSKLKGLLINAGLIITTTATLLFTIEVALSTLVYREKGYVEPAFCKGEFAYTASCTDPHPLFHLRIAGLALFNALTLRAPYRPRRFEELNKQELDMLESWRGRGSRRDPLPWQQATFVEYIYDPLGRRVANHSAVPRTKTQFIAFFGGSWVHGDWLPYEQTLPGQMGKRLPEFQVYNYGIQGGGLQELFLGAHGPNFIQGIPEKSGIWIYVHNWMHFDRLRPSVEYIAGRFNYPMAEYVDGKELGFGGSFYERFPVLTPALAFAYHSGVGRLTGLSRKMFPRWNLPELYCDLLVQTRDRLKSLGGSTEFVVLIYGREDRFGKKAPLIHCLEQNGIPYRAPFFDDKLIETYLPDGHPDGPTHQKMADHLTEWMRTPGHSWSK